MGTAHGGLRQKNFNFYEESTRVPLVYSNPRLFPAPQVNHAIVSHVDFLPTLASLLDVPPDARDNWQGIDYADQILSRTPRPSQDYTVFTYDDWQSGQASGPYPKPPNHIVSIREHRYKLARYYDADGQIRRSGKCMTWKPTRSSASTWPTTVTRAPPRRNASTCGCSAS